MDMSNINDEKVNFINSGLKSAFLSFRQHTYYIKKNLLNF